MRTWQMQMQPSRGWSRGLPLRALLLMGATVVLLIVGLLGMHALDGSGAGHSASSTAQADRAITQPTGTYHSGAGVVAHVEHRHAAGVVVAAVAGDSHKHVECGDACVSAPVRHEHTAVACVLALLSAMLILVLPGGFARARVLAVTLRSAVDAVSTQIAPRPPSLIQLSISRT